MNWTQTCLLFCGAPIPNDTELKHKPRLISLKNYELCNVQICVCKSVARTATVRSPQSSVRPPEAIINSSYGVSTKMDFSNGEDVKIVNSTSKSEDEDVEVKHTIVVSTKLKNNNRRGIHSQSDGDSGILTYSVGTPKPDKEDSGEVPIIPGYKSVDTTVIRTPDTRLKAKVYPDSVLISRNIRDDYDVIPNLAMYPSQWKPSNHFNNINWWGNDIRQPNNERRIGRPLQHNNKFHRKITSDGAREFYCQKCREMSVGQQQPPIGCNYIQQRSNPWTYETTTHKVKIDGKLAKLN